MVLSLIQQARERGIRVPAPSTITRPGETTFGKGGEATRTTEVPAGTPRGQGSSIGIFTRGSRFAPGISGGSASFGGGVSFRADVDRASREAAQKRQLAISSFRGEISFSGSERLSLQAQSVALAAEQRKIETLKADIEKRRGKVTEGGFFERGTGSFIGRGTVATNRLISEFNKKSIAFNKKAEALGAKVDAFNVKASQSNIKAGQLNVSLSAKEESALSMVEKPFVKEFVATQDVAPGLAPFGLETQQVRFEIEREARREPPKTFEEILTPFLEEPIMDFPTFQRERIADIRAAGQKLIEIGATFKQDIEISEPVKFAVKKQIERGEFLQAFRTTLTGAKFAGQREIDKRIEATLTAFGIGVSAAGLGFGAIAEPVISALPEFEFKIPSPLEGEFIFTKERLRRGAVVTGEVLFPAAVISAPGAIKTAKKLLTTAKLSKITLTTSFSKTGGRDFSIGRSKITGKPNEIIIRVPKGSVIQNPDGSIISITNKGFLIKSTTKGKFVSGSQPRIGFEGAVTDLVPAEQFFAPAPFVSQQPPPDFGGFLPPALFGAAEPSPGVLGLLKPTGITLKTFKQPDFFATRKDFGLTKKERKLRAIEQRESKKAFKEFRRRQIEEERRLFGVVQKKPSFKAKREEFLTGLELEAKARGAIKPPLSFQDILALPTPVRNIFKGRGKGFFRDIETQRRLRAIESRRLAIPFEELPFIKKQSIAQRRTAKLKAAKEKQIIASALRPTEAELKLQRRGSFEEEFERTGIIPKRKPGVKAKRAEFLRELELEQSLIAIGRPAFKRTKPIRPKTLEEIQRDFLQLERRTLKRPARPRRRKAGRPPVIREIVLEDGLIKFKKTRTVTTTIAGFPEFKPRPTPTIKVKPSTFKEVFGFEKPLKIKPIKPSVTIGRGGTITIQRQVQKPVIQQRVIPGSLTQLSKGIIKIKPIPKPLQTQGIFDVSTRSIFQPPKLTPLEKQIRGQVKTQLAQRRRFASALGISPIQRPRKKVKEAEGVTSFEAFEFAPMQAFADITKPIAIPRIKGALRIAERQREKERLRELQRLFPRQLPRQRERIAERERTREVVKEKTKTFTIPLFPPIPPRKPKVQRTSRRGEGFKVSVRSTGKTIKGRHRPGKLRSASPFVFSEAGARALGQSRVARNPKRTFAVEKATGQIAIFKGRRFRPQEFSRKGMLFTEKNKFAINTMGELLGITRKGNIARSQSARRKRTTKTKRGR